MADVKKHLKQAVKTAIYWGLPEGIAEFGMRQWKAFRENRHEVMKSLHANMKFKNRHKGERCFILACGPSIKEQDLTLLKNEISISVSNFFMHPDYGLIRPRYHCIPDISTAHGDFHTEEYAKRWFREMERKTGEAILFLSDGEKKLIKSSGLFRNTEVHYLHFGEDWTEIEKSGIDITRFFPFPQSSSVLALAIAVYMGFEEIYLLGCDHDWILHHGTSLHFYEENENIMATRPGYSEWAGSDYELQFRCSWNLWDQYKKIYRYSQTMGINIYNATVGGLLDVFPRVRYETLFQGTDLTRGIR